VVGALHIQSVPVPQLPRSPAAPAVDVSASGDGKVVTPPAREGGDFLAVLPQFAGDGRGHTLVVLAANPQLPELYTHQQ
jgi:hypothetical protein